jgi:predicted nucleic acid-binding protein
VRVVIADTGPLNYLLLIDEIELLPRLFEAVHIPETVRDELAAGAAPPIVRDWITAPPSWLLISPVSAAMVAATKLDQGEQAAIDLAITLKADLLLMDDRAGVRVALAQGFEVVGTFGILDQAARIGLIDLPTTLARLTATNFRVCSELIEALLGKGRTEG